VTPAGPAHYSVRRVQQILGLSRSMLAGLVDAGYVTPERGPRQALRFSFRDLMLLRTAQLLHAAGIAPRRIVRSLSSLKASLPDSPPLTGLRIGAIGDRVAVWDASGAREADSGQRLMDFEFEVAPRGRGIAFLPAREAVTPATRSAQDWFNCGEALERSDPAAAEAAYRQALASDPGCLDACLNLGALWCEQGRCAEAAALYQAALPRFAQAPLVHFNHAIALEDLGHIDAAIASYRRCLVLAPQLADAHFNLARLQERLGLTRDAVRHFNAYRRLQG